MSRKVDVKSSVSTVVCHATPRKNRSIPRSFVKGRPKVNRWKTMKKIPVGAFLFFFLNGRFWGENGKGFWLERHKLKTSQGGLFQGLISVMNVFADWLRLVSFATFCTPFLYMCVSYTRRWLFGILAESTVCSCNTLAYDGRPGEAVWVDEILHWNFDDALRGYGETQPGYITRLLTEISSLNYFCSEDSFGKALRRVMLSICEEHWSRMLWVVKEKESCSM